MKVLTPSDAPARPADPRIAGLLPSVTPSALRRDVEALAFPRHFEAEAANNRRAAEWIADRFRALGLDPAFEGPDRNVVAATPAARTAPALLIGAHYDTVAGTPGADDNASGVAALLACAGAIAAGAPGAPVVFSAFNREEEGLVGSGEFVKNFLPGSGLEIRGAHVLEMVGFARREPGSQRIPPGLPVRAPDVGDFLALIGNRISGFLLDAALEAARAYLPDFPVLGLKIPLGLERVFPVLRRSDHGPFWAAGIPAVQWTDTAEFRNPNYHRPADTPETLDYDFLAGVARLTLACAARGPGGE